MPLLSDSLLRGMDSVVWILAGAYRLARQAAVDDEPAFDKPPQKKPPSTSSALEPEDLLASILSKNDWEFVRSRSRPELRRMYCRDRREVQRRWLTALRRRVERALRPRPAFVSRARFAFMRWSGRRLFQAACGALLFLSRFGNPLRQASAARGLAQFARRLESLFENSAAQSPAPLENPAKNRIVNLELDEAIERINRRELSGLRSEFSALTYLASARDYNSGRYFHEALARSFRDAVMEQAMTASHERVFERLAGSPLSELTRQLEIYVEAVPESPTVVLNAWSKLEPFRILIPLRCDPVLAELFISNVRLALAILQGSRTQRPMR